MTTNTTDLGVHQKPISKEIIESIPGALLVIVVAVVAFYVGPWLKHNFVFFKEYLTLKSFILAILFGIIIKNTIGVSKVFEPGLRFSTILTKTGIVVMGAKYSMAKLLEVGVPAMLFTIIFLFGSALVMMWVGRRMKMSTALTACLASGLSVCGVSATVAVAPAVNAKNRDMAYSIAVVLMFGLAALLIFPFIGQALNMTDEQFGAFCGIGIVNSAQVLAAGFGYSDGAGVVAGVYNIGRVIFLPFVVLMVAIMATSMEVEKTGKKAKEINKIKMLIDKFPLFVIGFLIVVALNTMGLFEKPEVHMMKTFMSWAFLFGFASIGLTTRLADLKAAGMSGFVLGFIVASIKAVLALLVVMTVMS